jgi:hypothetical protein
MLDFWNWITRDSISFFTFILAIFTIVLAATSFWQGLATHRSVNLAADEFRVTHRPRVTVRSFQTLAEVGQAPSITFLYVNTGDLPAKVIEIRTCVGVGNVKFADPIFERRLLRGVTLESGDKEIMEVMPPANFHFQRGFSGEVGYQGEVGHEADAYLIGCVIYEDGKGRRRETGFCRVSEGSIQPWVTIKESEYEYQD